MSNQSMQIDSNSSSQIQKDAEMAKKLQEQFDDEENISPSPSRSFRDVVAVADAPIKGTPVSINSNKERVGLES
ncbi:MAG: hypothetical protein HON90_03480, partial [Halobacteriovoraceae bacterium]|nr:hypothetical protein [Halobacteriovoraceae bacterium]